MRSEDEDADRHGPDCVSYRRGRKPVSSEFSTLPAHHSSSSSSDSSAFSIRRVISFASAMIAERSEDVAQNASPSESNRIFSMRICAGSRLSLGTRNHVAHDLSAPDVALVLFRRYRGSEPVAGSPISSRPSTNCTRVPRGLFTELHHVGDEHHRAGGRGATRTTHHGHAVA